MAQKLVSVKWLEEHLADENLILLDASVHFDEEKTIPKARHFDIKNVFSDTTSPFPNTFPNVDQFERESRNLGINNDSHIIVFDDKGIFTSPRVWWMFTIMGHTKVSLLDGGLPEWHRIVSHTNFPNSVPYRNTQGNFTAQFQSDLVKTYDEILTNHKSDACVIVDARSRGRFLGTDPEPRTHIKSGHIPNSINLPYTEVLTNGKYKSTAELKALFSSLNLSNKPIIFSCGSGISACIILLALELISDQKKSVYDGSWTEWAEKQKLLV